MICAARNISAFQQEHRRLVMTAGGIIFLLLFGYFAARPTEQAVRSWQARRHAAKAFQLIDQEKWVDASIEARAAYQLKCSEPQAIRAVARLLSHTQPADALPFWKLLGEKEALRRTDLRDEAGAALAASDLTLAGTAVNELLGKKEGGPGAAEELLAAQFALQKGRPSEVESHLTSALADPRVTRRQQLQATLLQLRTTLPDAPGAKDTQAAAWKRVSDIARGQDAVALDALTIIAQQLFASPDAFITNPGLMSAAEVIHGLEHHPLSRATQRLVALDLRAHEDPSQREAVIEQALDSLGKGDTEGLVALARWLNNKEEYQRELDTIPLARAVQSRELFLQHLDALGGLSQWSEIKRLLVGGGFPLDPVVEAMYLARCNQKLGEVTASENNWQRAFEAAADDPQKLLGLADYAEKNGATALAGRAYDAIVREAPHLRAAHQGRLRLAQQSRETTKIHAVLAEMLKQWPNDSAIQNDEAYTRLLLVTEGSHPLTTNSPNDQGGTQPAVLSDPSITHNQELTAIARLAEQLVQREPASLPHRTLFALARLSLGKAAEALQLYEGIRVSPSAASPSAIAVHSAVLAANHQEEDARAEASGLKGEQLLPQEQELVQKLRN